MSPTGILLWLSLLSGTGGVTYEVLYLRQLTAVLGDMFYVHAAILSIFLLGLGVGALSARRFLSSLHVFELATGLYAWCFPTLAGWYAGSPADIPGHPGVQAVLASTVLLAVPALAMGFSIPLFAAYLKRLGLKKAALPQAYALYNVGAAVGMLLVEFLLVRAVGVAASLRLLGSLSLVCGVILWKRPDLRQADPEPDAAGPAPWRDHAALFLASLGGALFSAFFLKVGYNLFLPYRENFAICSAASLLAFAAGAWLVRRFELRFVDCALGSALGIGVVYAAFPSLSELYRTLIADVPNYGASIWVKLAFALVLGGLPMVGLGGAIPALAAGSPRLARDSGRFLFVSGVANALGILGFVFLAHPYLKLFLLPVLAVALLAVAATLQQGTGLLRQRIVTLCALLLMSWKIAGINEDAVYTMNAQMEPNAEVTTFKSASDNVTYVRGKSASLLLYNGVVGLHIRSSDKVNIAETAYGVIPALTAPRRQKALVLGMGTGITAGVLAGLFDRTDIVEINGACLPLLPVLAEANMGLHLNSRASIFHDDGRRFLARASNRYDAIINTLPSPDYSAASKLHTLEFYDLVKRALAPDGVYALWFTFRDMSGAGVRTILATLSQRFRHCGLALVRGNYYALVCSDAEVRPRPAAKAGLSPALRRAVEAGTDGADPIVHFNNVLLTPDVFPQPGLKNAQPNRDDLPILEFQVLAARYEKDMPDQVAINPQAFNIRLPGPEDPHFVDRALLFVYGHPAIFQRWAWPILSERPKLMRRFLDRLVETFQPRQAEWDAEAWLQLAAFAERASDLDRALRYCGEAARKAPLSPRVASMMARLHGARRNEREAKLWTTRMRALGG